ncbi:hypothetical protein [Streptosporangium jomthongense]|uniref:Uncharacterized protein n=1 Tax=Streptosporangium jomthongense TaxID=1193683 RepID=A0ABV8FDS5_9ACTN
MNDFPHPFVSDEPDPYTETALVIGVIYPGSRPHPHPPHWIDVGADELGDLYPDEVLRRWGKGLSWDDGDLNHVPYLVPKDDFRDGEQLVFAREHQVRVIGPDEFAVEPRDIENLRRAAQAGTSSERPAS